MNSKDVCQEESKTLGLTEGREERASDGLRFPNLDGWEREDRWFCVDNLGFQKWRDALGRRPAGRRKCGPGPKEALSPRSRPSGFPVRTGNIRFYLKNATVLFNCLLQLIKGEIEGQESGEREAAGYKAAKSDAQQGVLEKKAFETAVKP